VDTALKEAIRRSLQDLKDKKAVAAATSSETVAVADAAESKVGVAEGNLKAPPAAVAAAATTTATFEPPSSTSTSRYAVSVDSDDDDEDNVEDDVKKQAARIEAALFGDEKQPPKVETTSVVETVPAPATPQPSAPLAEDDDAPAPDTAHVNVSVAASEFSEDALGNGDVAAALGNMMDVVASCIQEMNGQLEQTVDDDQKSLQSNDDDDVEDDHDNDGKLGAKIVDGEEHRPDDLSVDSGSSHGSWVVDDEFAASPEAMARAAMVIGSSLLSSDMAQSSTGHPHPETATSTLSSSSGSGTTTSSSGASAESFSSVGSVPTTVPSIAAAAAATPSAPTTTAVVGHITEDQLQRWSVQLRHLHELGFHEDAVLVDIIERLHAANVGVDSTDEVTVQQVVHELIKTWK
jgi:hypothetical protein